MNSAVYKLISTLVTGILKKRRFTTVNYSFTNLLILKTLQSENFIRSFVLHTQGKKRFLVVYLSKTPLNLNLKTLSKIENRLFLSSSVPRKEKLSEAIIKPKNKQNMSSLIFSNSNFGYRFSKDFGECLFIFR
jgi:ribosomal protein S8